MEIFFGDVAGIDFFIHAGDDWSLWALFEDEEGDVEVLVDLV